MTPDSVVVAFLDPGHWSACFGMSYRDLCLHDVLGPQRIIRPGGLELRALTGSGGIPANRNKACTRFLDDTDGEWLFFIDTDMGFAPETVDLLIKAADPFERPIMGGLAFALKRKPRGDFYAERTSVQPTVYEFLELEDEVGFRPILDYPRDQVTQVAGTGAACLLIHRTALERMREAHGDVWFEPLSHPTGDRGKPRGFSEDLSFCVRAAGCGLPIHVDTSVKTCHDKGGVFLDEFLYDQQRGA